MCLLCLYYVFGYRNSSYMLNDSQTTISYTVLYARSVVRGRATSTATFSMAAWGWPLQWCHNECDGFLNHQPHDCLSTVYSVADYKKYQSPASLAFVRGIHRWPVNSSHKGPVTRKMFQFDDVIMQSQPICFQTFYRKWTTCCLLIDPPLTLRLSWKSHGC